MKLRLPGSDLWPAKRREGKERIGRIEGREGIREGGRRTNDVRTPGTWVTRTYGLFRGEEK